MRVPSSAPETMSLSFSRELYDAVRTEDTALNKLITSRLPLCLPPHTNSPLLYVQGLMCFGSIYEAFESRLAQEMSRQGGDERIGRPMKLLDVPGLRRTGRLRRDVEGIKRLLLDTSLGAYDRERVKPVRLLDDVSVRIAQKPYLILAHAWAMYLALFNGGRWIRKQLRDAGEDFWMGAPPMSFWEFEGDQDGDDVHLQFKENFENAARQLTAEERAAVVQEARGIFSLCSQLVEALDEIASDETKRSLGQRAEKVDGRKGRLWTAFGYVGLVYLLKLAWPALLQI